MVKSVIVLTLSLKFGDYCIAAYDALDNKIIRLVKDTTEDNGIPKEYALGIHLLDEVNINVVEECPIEHQTENVIIDLDYGLKKTGRHANISGIYNRLQQNADAFGNNKYKMSNISSLKHSLEIIQFKNIHILQKEINGKPKTKANFICNSQIHENYSVTDARYFDCDMVLASGYLVVSLPATSDYTNQYGYFKYIAAIYPDEMIMDTPF